MENPIGNGTTIVNTIIVAIAGIIFGKWGATLLQLGIDQTILVQIISFIVFTVFAYFNAKNHNTYFDDKTTSSADNESPVLNDEYMTGDSDDIEP